MKPEFKITRSNELVTLDVAGDLTVQYAEEIKKHLLQFSEEDNDLKLSLALVTDMDVSSVQLVYALKRVAKLSKRELSIVFPADHNASELLIRTGMMKLLTDIPMTTNKN
jgi:hypothetical protein